jgi:hypothetical protein
MRNPSRNILGKLKTLEPRRVQGGSWPKGIRSKEGIGRCLACRDFFYHKKWWTKDQLNTHLQRRLELKDKTFAQWLIVTPEYPMQCPKDREKRDHVAEGVLYISGLRPEIKSEVLHLVKNSEEYATGRTKGSKARWRRPDIEDTILSIDDRGKNITIEFSENQLALRIAKKLHRSFKGGTLGIHFSHNEDAVRVYWTAP